MTKAELAEMVKEQVGMTKSDAFEMLEEVLGIIKDTLETGEDIMIAGFGKFEVREKSERRGRNPQTGADMVIDRRKVVTFRPSGILKDRVNEAPAG